MSLELGKPPPRKGSGIEAFGGSHFIKPRLISGAGLLVSQRFTVTRLQISWGSGYLDFAELNLGIFLDFEENGKFYP